MSTNPIKTLVTSGFWIYLMSDCVLFAGLFATYVVLVPETFGAPSIESIVSMPYVLLETLILLTSSFTMGLAVLAAGAGKRAGALALLGLTLALGLAFLGMEGNEFITLIGEGHGPNRSAFLSAFFTLLGTHGLHVFAASIWMCTVMAHVWLRGLGEGTQVKLACLALFWHFLDIIWIFIFTFVYLFGALGIS